MRALVTGANGFVGRYLVEHLLENGDDILGCDILLPEKLTYPFKSLDITDAQACATIIKDYKPDVIYHLAGMAFVPQAEDDFRGALNSNVLGTNSIYRICHLLERNCRVVLISSAEVYGRIDQSALPLTENTPISPANNYSMSKAMAEIVARRYNDRGQVPGVIMRPFNHIGPGQNERFVCSNFAMQLARIAHKLSAPELLVGNLEAKRDFSDVRDIVRAYRLAGTRGSGIYNVGSGRAIRIRDILSMLVEASGLRVEIKEDPSRMRAAEVPVVYGDYSKAKAELGWEPAHRLEDTLKELFNWWYERLSKGL